MSNEKNMALLMADLSGYSALTEVHGADSALSTIKKYESLAHKAITGKAKLLERVGDELLIVSPNAYDIAVTTKQLVAFALTEPDFLPVHAGVHYGKVLESEGRLFGNAINITARVAAKAPEGKILCTDDFISNLQPAADFNFLPLKKIYFKNMIKPVTVAEMITNHNHMHSMYIDPVCHMQVEDPDIFHYTFMGEVYHFCSVKCLELFSHTHRLN